MPFLSVFKAEGRRNFVPEKPVLWGIFEAVPIDGSSKAGLSGDMEETLAKCKALLDKIEAMAPSLQLILAAQNIIEILSRPAVREEYANAQNMASIVFQNHRTREASLTISL